PQGVDYRRAVRRDEGARRRVHPDRRAGPGRSGPAGREDPRRDGSAVSRCGRSRCSNGNQRREGGEPSMSLNPYFHPFSSFCPKALVALYENDTPFEPHIVDLGDEKSSAAFKRIWPIGKFPVLRDEAMDRTIPESTIIIEYLAQHYPGKTQLIPGDLDLAWQTRMRDRFYDLYVNVPMGKIVTDNLRPPGRNDPHGVEQA